ncbi:MAG: hypothetical protein NTZ16_12675 [Verrucomicrobia bacterium]|nr:hypothetical protein [Verrucomicrobiota bacterium]
MSAPDSIHIKISGAALAVIPRIKNQLGLARAIARTMDDLNQGTIAVISQKYLSGPTTPTSLSVRTNVLRGSIRNSPAVITPGGVTSSIGTNVVYARIHEFGGVIHRTQQAGIIRLRTTRSGQLIRRGKNGKLAVFAGRQHKNFRNVAARGASWTINMPARAPIQHGIADRAPAYSESLSECVLTFWKKEQA